jgi:hypothetical protein
VLDEFANAHELAGCAELLLCGFEGGDGGEGAVGAVEVPCEEAGKVLKCAEEFVATDCCMLGRIHGEIGHVWG